MTYSFPPIYLYQCLKITDLQKQLCWTVHLFLRRETN